MRKIAALVLVLLPSMASADAFFFAGGAFQKITTAAPATVPDVVGQASTGAAETILVAAGLVLGNTIPKCSIEPSGEILDQDPNAGLSVDVGSSVALLFSNGVRCPKASVNKAKFGFF